MLYEPDKCPPIFLTYMCTHGRYAQIKSADMSSTFENAAIHQSVKTDKGHIIIAKLAQDLGACYIEIEATGILFKASTGYSLHLSWGTEYAVNVILPHVSFI